MSTASDQSPYERIMARTMDGPTARPELGPCLDCTLTLTNGGYPQVRTGHGSQRKMALASRVVLAQDLGRPIRDGYCALHHCDRPSCVRPSHLYEGTISQNLIDAYTRGQKVNPFTADVHAKCTATRKARGTQHRAYGESNPFAKLTLAQVREIRYRAASGERQRSIARAVGTTDATVSRIVNNKIWVAA